MDAETAACKNCSYSTYSAAVSATSEETCLPCPTFHFSYPGSTSRTQCIPPLNDTASGEHPSTCEGNVTVNPECLSDDDCRGREGRGACQNGTCACVFPYGGLRCSSCQDGLTGDKCECNCNGHGRCKHGSPRCECSQRWIGRNCSIRDCAPGFLRTELGSCVACPTGTYKDKTSQGDRYCQKCGVGKYATTEGNSAESDCIACVAGKFSGVFGANDSSVCQDCGPGKYLETVGNDDESDCILCGAGKFSNATGADNATVCQECAAGTFKDAEGSGACTPCPEFTNSPRGSNAEASCVCKPGYSVLATLIIQRIPDDSCSTANDGVCDEARYGECAIHSVCSPGTDATDCSKCALPCAACAAGTYKGVSGSAPCTQCFDGATSPPASTSQASCNCLAGRKYDDQKCTACEKGKYKTRAENTQCTNCPGDYYSDVASTALDACVNTPKTSFELSFADMNPNEITDAVQDQILSNVKIMLGTDQVKILSITRRRGGNRYL